MQRKKNTGRLEYVFMKHPYPLPDTDFYFSNALKRNRIISFIELLFSGRFVPMICADDNEMFYDEHCEELYPELEGDIAAESNDYL